MGDDFKFHEPAKARKVMLGLPLRGVRGRNGMADASGAAHWACPEEGSGGAGFDIVPAASATSILPYTFNQLWAGSLNMRRQGVTHFAMQHDDVVPERGWLATLLAELDRTGADIVSAVVPIKDHQGLTSTAIDDTGDEWQPRRLTMTEVYELPETFTDPRLLVNTGLWVCDLTRPWCDKVYFRQQDDLLLRDGEWMPRTRPEDWDFSRQVRALGGVLYATRKVRLHHELPHWHNCGPWGTLTTDYTPDGRLVVS